MPNHKTHIIGGFIFVSIGLILLNKVMETFVLETIMFPIIALVTLVYSIAPDIDHPMSKIRKWFMRSLFGGLIGLFIYSKYIDNMDYFIWGAIAAATFGFIVVFSSHREKKQKIHTARFHTMIIGAILAAPLFFLHPIYFFTGVVAYASHLILDSTFSKKTKKTERFNKYNQIN